MMNFFGRNKKNTARPSVNFTSATEITTSPSANNTTTVSPPAIAFQHSRDSHPHQTIAIELTPSGTVKTSTASLQLESTMKELHDFRIDDDDDSSFDDVEFGEQIVNAATAHVVQERKRFHTIWVISGIVFVGVCVGLIAAIVVNSSRSSSSGGGGELSSGATTPSLPAVDAAMSEQQSQNSLSYFSDIGQEWNASLFNASEWKSNDTSGVP